MIAFLNAGKINILKISYMLPGKIFSSFIKKNASSQKLKEQCNGDL